MLYYHQLLVVNCAFVSVAGLCEALCQKCCSDLCCCFSCFCAGPERAVHTTRDGSPCPRQPGPSHREERYIQAANIFICLANCLIAFPSTCDCLPPAICLFLSYQDLHKCRRIDILYSTDMWIQSSSHTNVDVRILSIALELDTWYRFSTLKFKVV